MSVPVSADELECQRVIENCFNLGINGGDVTKVQADFIALMVKQGASTTQVEQYVLQIKTLSSVIVTNDSAMISIEIDKFIVSQEKFCKSQLGLEDFLNDSDIQLDANFSEFRTMYAAFLSETKEIKTNTGYASEYFTTKVKAKYARLITVTIEASKKAAAKKGLLSEYLFVSKI